MQRDDDPSGKIATFQPSGAIQTATNAFSRIWAAMAGAASPVTNPRMAGASAHNTCRHVLPRIPLIRCSGVSTARPVRRTISRHSMRSASLQLADKERPYSCRAPDAVDNGVSDPPCRRSLRLQHKCGDWIDRLEKRHRLDVSTAIAICQFRFSQHDHVGRTRARLF